MRTLMVSKQVNRSVSGICGPGAYQEDGTREPPSCRHHLPLETVSLIGSDIRVPLPSHRSGLSQRKQAACRRVLSHSLLTFFIRLLARPLSTLREAGANPYTYVLSRDRRMRRLYEAVLSWRRSHLRHAS